MKLCDHCKKRAATVHYTQKVNGKKTEWELCSTCAAQLGLGVAGFSGEELFGAFPFFTMGVPREEKQEEACPVCKKTLSRIRKDGKFGCSACYDTFAKKLDLTPFIGSGYQSDKTPEKKGEKNEKAKADPVSDLKERLQKAIKEENYELAAHLRDEIRAKEEKGCTGTN